MPNRYNHASRDSPQNPNRSKPNGEFRLGRRPAGRLAVRRAGAV